jgi:hypothetical protein
VELYCSLMLDFGQFCTGYVGDSDGVTQVTSESLLGYHAELAGVLTRQVNPCLGQRLVGSLTGAVAS